MVACRKYMQSIQGEEALGWQLNSRIVQEKILSTVLPTFMSIWSISNFLKVIFLIHKETKKTVYEGAISSYCPQREAACSPPARRPARAGPQSMESLS